MLSFLLFSLAPYHPSLPCQLPQSNSYCVSRHHRCQTQLQALDLLHTSGCVPGLRQGVVRRRRASIRWTRAATRWGLVRRRPVATGALLFRWRSALYSCAAVRQRRARAPEAESPRSRSQQLGPWRQPLHSGFRLHTASNSVAIQQCFRRN